MGSGEVEKNVMIPGTSSGKDATFSIMKGLAIVSVVLGHVYVGTRCEMYVNYYHLATFFFVSGFFLKDSHLDNMLDYCWRRFKQLYVPFMKYGLLYIFLHNILYYIGVEKYLYDSKMVIHELRNITIGMTSEEPLMGAMWFCPALLVVSILSSCMLKMCMNRLAIIKILLLISLPLIGYVLCELNIKSPRCLWQYMQICGIYVCGYYFKKWKYYAKLRYNKILTGGISLYAGITIYLLSNLGITANLQPSAIMDGNVFSLTIIGIIGALGVWGVSSWVERIPVVSSTLKLIGDSSFSIMALHFLCFNIISYIYCCYNHIDLSEVQSFPVIANVGYWNIFYVLIGVFVPIGLRWIYNSIMTENYTRLFHVH